AAQPVGGGGDRRGGGEAARGVAARGDVRGRRGGRGDRGVGVPGSLQQARCRSARRASRWGSSLLSVAQRTQRPQSTLMRGEASNTVEPMRLCALPLVILCLCPCQSPPERTGALPPPAVSIAPPTDPAPQPSASSPAPRPPIVAGRTLRYREIFTG